MDLDWVILSDEGLLDYLEDDDNGEKGSFNAKNSNPKTKFKPKHFFCPSSPPRNSKVFPKNLVDVPTKFDLPTNDNSKESEVPKEVNKVPVGTTSTEATSVIIPEIKTLSSVPTKEADQEPVSQLSFKKVKENDQSVDTILDSAKSCVKGIFMPPQTDHDMKEEAMETKLSSPRIKNEEGAMKEEVSWEGNNGGLNPWKWSLNGIGAICSFGVAAAATICLIILGSHHQKDRQQQQQNQRLRFQVCTDDKRIKEVVQHATKLNEAISAVRGVPITRAHINFGGYHDVL